MPRYESAALREERASLHTKLNDIFQSATAEKRELTAEETQEAARIEQRFNDASTELRQLELVEGYSPEARQVERNATEEVETRAVVQTPEYRSTFDRYVTSGDASELRAAFNVTTDATGGFAVPEDWDSVITKALLDFGSMRKLATVKNTPTGRPFHVPVVATQMTAAVTAEGNSITESEDTLTEVILGAYNVDARILMSAEWDQDALGSPLDFVAERAGEAIALKEDQLYVTGTGPTTQPTGIATRTTLGKTAASTTAIVSGELIDLYYSVNAPNRALGSWLVADTTAAAIRKLNDSTGVSLWQPGLAVGQPDTFLGRPFYTDVNVAAIATGAKAVLFGNFSRYVIRDAGTRIQVLRELYAATGQIGIIVRRRVDGNLVDTAAVKHLILA